MRIPLRPKTSRHRSSAQTVVEFALVLPVLVLLLLIALDFGRAFLGWVSLNNAARVGANYAAAHPNDTWGPGSDYQVLMADNMDAINCTPSPAVAAAPVFGATNEPGDIVRVNLTCDFSVLTPIIGSVLGNVVTVSSSAAFPITYGCLADCGGGGAPPPPPPPASNCRTVPNVTGMSVAGARLAWTSAGFISTQFVPGTGDDTRTVDAQAVTESPNTDGCTGAERYYDSTMTVTLAPIVPVTAGCGTVPNLIGVTVATARSAWTAAGFTGAFLPADSDTRVVNAQVTDAPSNPGDCMPPGTSVVVSHGPPLPAPPPAPCKVPSFINTSSANAQTTWTNAGFDGGNIAFSRGGTFVIQSQSLVGGTVISCAAEIEVSHKAGNTP